MVSKSLLLAGLSVLTVAGLGVWGWSVDPEHPSQWAFVVFSLPALWGFVELFQGGRRRERIMDWHRYVFACTGLMLAVKVGPQLAISTGVLDAHWAPISHRIWGVTVGSLFAIWGNYVPKVLSPWSEEEQWFDWQRVHRFVGWLASLSGVGLVVVWLAFPLPGARLTTLGICVALCVLGVGRKLISVAEYSRRQPPPPQLEATLDSAGSE